MQTETVAKIEDQINYELDRLRSDNFEDPDDQKRCLDTICKLVDKQVAVEANDYEYWDKKERREIERERNQTTADLEREKRQMAWWQVALEVGSKVGVPILTFVGSMIAYGKFQERVMKFEETGRVSSTAGRELHLPNVFKR